MSSLLNERIAALRKERGLTQEQLGQMVGVSAQAVSKWEKGGAPDVDLLPAVAARLGVTIDALFGLESGPRVDIKEAAGQWLEEFPAEERMDQFCRLAWSMAQSFADDRRVAPEIPYPEHCEYTDGRLLLYQCKASGGIVADVHAEDMSFVTVCPRPEGGYAQWLAPKSEYRRLFEVLARPGCLELLDYSLHRYNHYFTPAVAAKQLGVSVAEAEELLAAMEERQLLWSMKLETESGETMAYALAEGQNLIPFLYLARCSMQRGMNLGSIIDVEPVLEKGEVWKNETEDK